MKRVLFGGLLLFCLVAFFSCGGPSSPKVSYPRIYEPQTILALGDSLTYGQGVARDQTYPAQLQQRLNAEGYSNYTIINAGVSGERTDQLLGRIDSELSKHDPGIVILTIGANDMLQNKNIVQAKENIRQMIEKIQAQDRIVLLSAMRVPNILSLERSKQFREIYPVLAKEYQVRMVEPHFLAGVMARSQYNQTDNIHPNAAGYTKIVDENVLPALWPLMGGKP